ncbi:MAG: PSD1 and planctomycete cytochrome C domain-containing protein, partial [Planctomycetes bacterium]|nr:PSD1 and planctomycete cytochrome C domain-containing protein [Planctomycetota bacterium]
METLFFRVASMPRPTIASSGGFLSSCAAIAIVLFFVFGAVSLRADDSAASDPTFFQAKIEPLLKSKCYGCHGTKRQKAELNLASPEAILKGGESGPVVVAGKPDESPLFEMVRDGLMPPKKKDRLSDEQVELIRRWIASGARLDAGEAPEERQLTLHDVKPFLLLRCTACHGTRRQEGGLDLRTHGSMLRGGKSGPAIVPGRPEESLILKRILAEEMPPRRRLVEVSVKTMTDHEVDLLTRWIAQGAVGSDTPPDVATRSPDPLVSDDERSFWSFRSPELVAVPDVSEGDRRRNPIDAFVAKKLSERALTFSPEADRRTLVRRAYFDLVGLPPDPETVDAFVADPDPRAYEKLVDRLLASPRYGERWGRYWLDLAGYSDSEGVQHSDRVRTHAYRYRDYVIRSFNSDKPYDEFLLEQIAGDELDDHASAEVITDEMYDRLVATGFLRMTTDGTYFQITNFVPDRLEQIADELDVLGASVMGLTLKCARCHSHKFDPIPQRDYYRLAAVFKGAYDEHDWLPPGKRVLPYVTTVERQEWDAREAKLKTALKPHQEALEKLRTEATQRQVEKRLAELPKTLRDDLRGMLSTPEDQRDEVQKYLAMKFEEKLRVDPDDLAKIDEEFKSAAEPIEKEVKRLEGERTPEPGVRALWDRGEPSPTYLLQRGNYLTSGRLIGPGVPSVLTDGRTPLDLEPPWEGAKKTGRRLAFARWLTSSDHPLTARVIVNRLWKHHFGRGIVKTLDNFGRAGARPTHPELLDWLAVKFVENGWRLKYLH